ncbi:ABC transporter substrate-binding protein [Wenjunlia vitaminophila]|uniref:ABC transporter substrate-binding protein n=1 Tax=Wenjunlia vitaminophila TaxID=76728 RepID=UPI000CECBD74|nr:ABC transporter substrate-binding protein [Wenjunlia vitaminophila]
MSLIYTRRLRAAAVGLSVGALVLTGCSSGGGGGPEASEDSPSESAPEQAQIAFADAKASTGPAPEVPGATPGGTIRVLQRDSYSHLDPAQIYVSDEMSLATLIHRGLTGYRMNEDGTYAVVGDLATDSGQVSDGGRTWTYRLKDGIKWQDGTPITAQDVRHTFERQFAPFLTSGPTFVQQWLAGVNGAEFRNLLKDGPYQGKHLGNDVLETPNDSTVVFHFKDPQPDLPFALAMAGYSVVPKAKDTKQKYDRAPVASGPYKIADFKANKSMTLVKNPEWDPKTDVIRHQYVDKFAITFNHQYEDSSKRLLSDSGENKTAISFNNSVDAASLPKVLGDAEAKKRTVSGFQPYVGQFAMNMDRLKDKRVREAIAYALPIKSVLQPYGGPPSGQLAGGLISPTQAGYQKDYDPYDKLKKPEGDPARAKKVLEEAGKVGTKLTFAYVNTPEGQQYSVSVASALEKAGFDVQRKDLPADTYYDRIGTVDNGYDIYHHSWGADWPSASTVIPPLFDGRAIADGAKNYSHVNDPKINSEIDRIKKITDQKKAADAWFELNKYILEDVLPAVPTYYFKHVQLHGSKVGGVVFSDVVNGVDPTRLYVVR